MLVLKSGGILLIGEAPLDRADNGQANLRLRQARTGLGCAQRNFFLKNHFCRLKSMQVCCPAPVDGIRAQDRPFLCTSASVPFRGPETDLRSVLGRSEITEIVTRSSGDPGQQDVAS